jgi:hypothetical protein
MWKKCIDGDIAFGTYRMNEVNGQIYCLGKETHCVLDKMWMGLRDGLDSLGDEILII